MRIWLSRPHMGGEERRLVDEAFDSNFIAPLGPQLNQFEADLAAYLGGDVHVLAVTSGTAALHLGLRLKGVEAGDKVWTTSMTFAGGAFPILYQNATPVFFDLSPTSWTLDADLIDQALADADRDGTLPKAIVPTDLYGQPCDLDRLEASCRKYGVALVIDSAESLGANYRDRKAGAGGDAAILSFNGNKIITTSGGGALVSKDKELIDRARFLSTQARENAPHYQHETFGYNYRLSNISAAIGIGQMRVLDQRVERRRAIFDRYQTAFAGLEGIDGMPEPNWARGTRWLSAFTFDPAKLDTDRETIRLALLEQQIEARPLWKPMHMQPLFKDTRYIGRGNDERLFANGLCLPSGSDMTDAEQDEVIGVILETVRAAQA